MPSWVRETANPSGLVVSNAYSRRAIAEALGVTPPPKPRDWGGLVVFANCVAIFVTLEKTPERFKKEHRYNDQFDGDALYWDSRATHTKESLQVKRLGDPKTPVLAFARLREKDRGKTMPFFYLGFLDFVSWWGTAPVHFSWKLRAFPTGLGGTAALDELAHWRPRESTSTPRSTSDRSKRHSPPAAPKQPFREGAQVQVSANRYERDPRARGDCLSAHGSSCNVCGFSFGKTYGGIGADFIYVHHRIPLAIRAQSGEYELDPKRDLVPLCGNCHAVVHLRREPHAPEGSLPSDQRRRLLELRELALGDSWEALD